MTEKVKEQFISRVRRDWESLLLSSQPWGMWIRYYAPISTDAKKIDSSRLPLQVWFLTRDGLFERNIWEYRRLQVVHFIQPWCGKMWGESSNWWAEEKPGIGFASFAHYEDSSDAYFDQVFAGLSGRGWRVKIDSNDEIVGWECLWMS